MPNSLLQSLGNRVANPIPNIQQNDPRAGLLLNQIGGAMQSPNSTPLGSFAGGFLQSRIGAQMAGADMQVRQVVKDIAQKMAVVANNPEISDKERPDAVYSTGIAGLMQIAAKTGDANMLSQATKMLGQIANKLTKTGKISVGGEEFQATPTQVLSEAKSVEKEKIETAKDAEAAPVMEKLNQKSQSILEQKTSPQQKRMKIFALLRQMKEELKKIGFKDAEAEKRLSPYKAFARDIISLEKKDSALEAFAAILGGFNPQAGVTGSRKSDILGIR